MKVWLRRRGAASSFLLETLSPTAKARAAALGGALSQVLLFLRHRVCAREAHHVFARLRLCCISGGGGGRNNLTQQGSLSSISST